MKLTQILPFIFFVGTFGLIGCAAEDEGGGVIEGTGVSPGTFSTGEISGFGSIFVNGVEYETDNADIEFNGVQGQLEDLLDIGMIVTVEGTINDDGVTGTAVRVIFDRELKGPISALSFPDNDSASLTVLGNQVTIDTNTVLANVELADLAAGHVIAISGYRLLDNSLLASYVEQTSVQLGDTEEVDMEGIITVLDTASMRLSIGEQSVDYSAATFSDLSSSDLKVNQLIEVEGTLAGATLIASQITLEETEFEADTEVEIEGVIASVFDDMTFQLNGIVVSHASAEIERGSADDIAINLKVEVEGRFNSAGMLVADTLKIEKDAETELTGAIEAISQVNNSITILNQTIFLELESRVLDDSDTDERFFRLDDLAIGDWVEVKAVTDNGMLYAQEIKRENEDPEQEYEFRGTVESINGSTWVVSGITVDTTQMEGQEELAEISVGDVVEIEGALVAAGTLRANSLELDD